MDKRTTTVCNETASNIGGEVNWIIWPIKIKIIFEELNTNGLNHILEEEKTKFWWCNKAKRLFFSKINAIFILHFSQKYSFNFQLEDTLRNLKIRSNRLEDFLSSKLHFTENGVIFFTSKYIPFRRDFIH